jgi:hypothetical protein
MFCSHHYSFTTALRRGNMGRRSANEGSIYQRNKGGLWVAQYLVDVPDGKTKRKYIYGKKRKDVADKLAEVQKERGEGLLLDAGTLTVAEFLGNWLESEKESVRESTHNRREQVLRLHIYPNIEHLRLSKLNALHVQRLYARETLEKYRYSPYIELQRRVYPNNPDKDDYLKALERLRNIMILFKLGYGSREMAMLRVNSKKRCPEAYEAFEKELEDL